MAKKIPNTQEVKAAVEKVFRDFPHRQQFDRLTIASLICEEAGNDTIQCINTVDLAFEEVFDRESKPRLTAALLHRNGFV